MKKSVEFLKVNQKPKPYAMKKIKETERVSKIENSVTLSLPLCAQRTLGCNTKPNLPKLLISTTGEQNICLRPEVGQGFLGLRVTVIEIFTTRGLANNFPRYDKVFEMGVNLSSQL